MEAKIIIKAMIYDSNLAECATTARYDKGIQTVNQFVRMQFGDYQVEEGEITDGEYLVVFADDENSVYPFNVQHRPEVVLKDIMDSEIWLWKIE